MSDEKYAGNDNHGNPKSVYLERIADADDETLETETKNKIWFSAYAANNPRSDHHWHCDACYDECVKRGKPEIYQRAYKRASASAS
jgi:hypothetical protein